ncbi:MAG: BolA family protein [Hyphomonadaceae bacterium]
MAEALNRVFSPSILEIEDQSQLHAGHAGARPGGETHYAVRIVADALAGKSRIERHRAVNDALAEEFRTGLHALTIRTD